MVDFRLLNGYQKATIIERFNGETIILYWEQGQLKKKETETRQQALKFINSQNLEINIHHLAGPNEQRKRNRAHS